MDKKHDLIKITTSDPMPMKSRYKTLSPGCPFVFTYMTSHLCIKLDEISYYNLNMNKVFEHRGDDDIFIVKLEISWQYATGK